MICRISSVASEHRIELAAFGFFRQIDGELIKVWSLAAARGARGAVRGILLGGRSDFVLHGAAHDGNKVLFEGIGFKLHQLFADVAHDPAKLLVRQQGKNGEAAAHLAGAVVDRTQGPCL